METLSIKRVKCPAHMGDFFILENDDKISSVMCKKNGYQVHITHWAKKCLKLGMVAIDIGANLGCFTIPFAKFVGNKGTVHAFECTKTIYQQLTTNVFINGLINVNTYHIGLSNKNGVMWVHKNSKNFSFLEPMYSGICTISNNITNHSVEVRTLDSYNFSVVHFIKIDVEEHIIPCLEGAIQTITNHKPKMIIEIRNDQLSDKLHTNKIDRLKIIKKILQPLGYKFKRISNHDFYCEIK